MMGMAHLLSVHNAAAAVCPPTTMTAQSLTETDHLEEWIKKNPSVLDATLMVVTTQFNSWAATNGLAKERPDVLALSTSGELVVIELKRDSDRRIHLQAITYGALVAGFTKEILAAAHADWLRRDSGEQVTQEEALERLSDHVDSELSDETFALPRLLLVAESFPSQVLTTVRWLSAVAPDLAIECHEYQLFEHSGAVVASFQRIFPVRDLEDELLRPIMSAGTAGVRQQLASSKRRAKSVTLIHDHGLIPTGAQLTFELEGLVKPAVIEPVMRWLQADPQRTDVTWIPDPARPLRWGAEPERMWSPSALRNAIFEHAGVAPAQFSAADAWRYDGQSLYWVANSVDQDE